LTVADPDLARLLEALRGQAVSALLRAMAEELETGAAVVPEPEHRDDAGKVLRSGPLKLPSRDDLEVTRAGRSAIRVIDSGPAPGGESLVARTSGGFEAEIHPFRWDAAELTVLSRKLRPDWTPLRRWFLEWFQSRMTEVAPDLYGALHQLEGPEEVPGGWSFTVDLGSAPTACIPDLIVALEQTGTEGMRLGHA
jgi:hypothetical protein